MDLNDKIEIKDEDVQEEDFSQEQLDSDDFDWKAEAQKLKGIAKRRATQLLKAKEALAKANEKIEQKPQNKETKPDTALLERLDKMALQVAGIKEADEIELFNKWKEQTSREADDIISNSIFQKELEELRTAKANQIATSNIKGEKGDSGVTNTPEYWRAKATKGTDGQLLFPEEMPRKMYTKVLDLLAKESGESSEELKFYNQ